MLTGLSSKWQELLSEGLDPIEKELVKLRKKKTILPEEKLVFNFARLTDYDNIKIVIIGQDPYPTVGNANGLAFSYTGDGKLPDSLKNIFRAIKNEKIIDKLPKNGDLSSWAEQGVLLINKYLTVEEKAPLSHKKLWGNYVQNLLEKIAKKYMKKGKKIVFMLWGNEARKFHKYIIPEYHDILESKHPSPLANTKAPKFYEQNNFTKANALLIANGVEYIRWDSVQISIKEQEKQKNQEEQEEYDDIPDDFDILSELDNFEMEQKKTNQKEEIKVPPAGDGCIVGNNECPVIFTDGGCKGNGKKTSKGAYAFYVSEGPYKSNIVYGCLNNEIPPTNIRAEGTAILKAMKFLIKNNNWAYAKIVSDSQFWIDMIEQWIPNWVKKGVDFNTKNNPDLVKKIWDTYTILTKNKKVYFIHVNSHNKSGWASYKEGSYEKFCYTQNDYVDKLCAEALNTLEPGKKKSKFNA